MRFEMGSNESCACGARPLQVAGRKAGIDEPYEWKSSRTGLWGASGASPAPTRHLRMFPLTVNSDVIGMFFVFFFHNGLMCVLVRPLCLVATVRIGRLRNMESVHGYWGAHGLARFVGCVQS
jgi:hypothetical protein